MTCGELRVLLAEFPQELEIVISYEAGCCEGNVISVSVETHAGINNYERPAPVILIEAG